MTIDFFVHPETPIFAKDNSPLLKEYIKQLALAAANSEYAVLVNNKKYFGNWDLTFPQSQKLESMIFSNGHTGTICEQPVGDVCQSDWEKLTDILVKDADIRIHGAYLGQCTSNLAMQIFGHIHLGTHWSNWDQNDAQAYSKWDAQQYLFPTFVYSGDISGSRIRLGVVWAPMWDKLLNKVTVISPGKLDYDHGNLLHQLIDDKTQVFAHERVNFI